MKEEKIYNMFMILLLLLILSIIGVVSIYVVGDKATQLQHSEERLRTFDDYLSYDPSVPVRFLQVKGDKIYFESNSVVFRTSDILWEDTLFCNLEFGRYKHQTQVWQDTITPRESGNTTWSYPLPENREGETCQMCGTVTITTELGYKKYFDYCTENFVINNQVIE